MSDHVIANMFYFDTLSHCIPNRFACIFSYIRNQVSCVVELNFAKQDVIVGWNFNTSTVVLVNAVIKEA